MFFKLFTSDQMSRAEPSQKVNSLSMVVATVLT